MGRAQPARGDGPAPVEACCGEKPNLLICVVFDAYQKEGDSCARTPIPTN